MPFSTPFVGGVFVRAVVLLVLVGTPLAAGAATIAYWRFESGAAFTQDSGGNATGPFNLTNDGGDNTNDAIVLPATGAGSTFPRLVLGTGLTNGGAARFTPSEVPPDSFTTPHNSAFDSQSFTIEAFVNLASEPGIDESRSIVSMAGATLTDRMMRLSVAGASSTSSRPSRALAVSLRTITETGGIASLTVYFSSSNMILTVGQDYYVAATVRFSSAGLQILTYVKNLTTNGALQTSTFNNATYVQLIPNLQPLRIGAATGASGEVAWDGVIDELRFSNTFLAQSELLISTPAAPVSAPSIVTQPDSQTITAGETVVFNISASGNPTPSFQWRKDGVNLAGETSSTLILSGTTAASAGAYSAVVSNNVGSVTSSSATLTVRPATPPIIVAQPVSQTVAAGGTAVFGLEATGSSTFSYQWRKNGVAIAGATSSLLVLRNLTSADVADYSCVLSNNLGTATSNSATLAVVTTNDPGRLSALSIRGQAGAGNDLMIAGIIVENSTVRTLIQGVGPTLGVESPNLAGSVLQNPNLELYQLNNGAFVKVQSNDDWASPASDVAGITAAAAATGATRLTNSAAKDSALLTTLSPGVYTANVNGVGNTTGVTLLQAYVVPSATDTGLLSALSIRGRVGTGGDVMIAGIIVAGSTAKTLVIQAVGPTLGAVSPDLAGSVLQNPKLELYQLVNGAFVKVRENDDWGGDSQISSLQTATGATVLSNGASRDSTLVITLAPGVYTANVSGVGNTGGVVLLQAYAVP